jgi:hypothetical protein
MNLRGLIFTLFIGGSLLLSRGIVHAEYPADLYLSKWQVCQSSAECTISKDPCRNYVGVNKKYFKEYTSWSEKGHWHCRFLGDKGVSKDTPVLCLNNKCHVEMLTETQTAPSSLVAETKKGLTWGLLSHSDELGIDRVGCYGRPRIDGSSDGQACDPYQGDTSCSIALPILCLKAEHLPRPNYAVTGKGHAMSVEYYNGWTGGHIGLTQPVRGDMLTSVEAADKMCAAALGNGYRMAEHHDGKYVIGMSANKYYGETWPSESQLSYGGWHWYAYGNIHDDKRFWVYINDQQQGNCWDNTTIPAAKLIDSRAPFDQNAAKTATPVELLKIARTDDTDAMTAFSAEPFQGVKREAVKILRTKYPDADFGHDKDQPYMHIFRHTMREFVIYRWNKTGNWQKPLTVQGPDRGGLSVRYYIKRGRWEGALMVPYSGTSDLHVFRETHVVKNSEDGNWHLWAEILTPPVDAPEEVKNNLVKLFHNWEKY